MAERAASDASRFDEVVRVSGPVGLATLLGMLVVAFGLVGAAMIGNAWYFALAPLGLALPILAMIPWKMRVTVTPTHVFVGQNAYPRDWLIPFAAASGVRSGTNQVSLGKHSLTIDDAAAERLAATLRTAHPTRIACRSYKLLPFLVLCFALLMASSLQLDGFARIVIGLQALLLPPLLLNLAQLSLRLGADGFAMIWARRTDFVAWARVREVRLDRNTVWIELADGAPAISLGGFGMSAVLAKCIAVRLQQAHEEYQRAEQSRTAFDELPEDVHAWMPRLRELASGPEAGYRARPLDDDACRAAAANPLLAPEKRAAALLVLRMRAPSDERVRVAVDAAAEPRLHVAMEEIANQEPEQAEAALARYLTRR